ncbi:hypothetical protein GE061_014173 [Apolygus lucorum]|uniref:Uncharacterized protein n=2 Tax=Apolygus lucorum TaxID=248454 RepID=A0A6A4JU75_APOLU|nr:hypothetical protein GE061_014173 [Apolygus lucorum]
MLTCDQCYGDLKDEELLICKGGCSSNFHYKCCGIVEVNFKKMSSAVRSKWKCSTCKSVSTIVTKLIAPLESKMKAINQDICELKKSSEYLSAQFDTFSKGLEEMKQTVGKLENDNKFLMDTVYKLQFRLDNIEQDSRKMNVEIHGIPETKNENLCDIVRDLSVKLNSDMSVVNAFRAGRSNPVDGPNTNRENRVRKIVAVLSSEQERQQAIVNSRKDKNLTADQFVSTWPKTRVFVTENLTAMRADLLWKTKLKAQEKGVKFVWIRNFLIHTRKKEDDPVKVVRSVDDLDKF